jgi:hypothetical protein
MEEGQHLHENNHIIKYWSVGIAQHNMRKGMMQKQVNMQLEDQAVP